MPYFSSIFLKHFYVLLERNIFKSFHLSLIWLFKGSLIGDKFNVTIYRGKFLKPFNKFLTFAVQTNCRMNPLNLPSWIIKFI